MELFSVYGETSFVRWGGILADQDIWDAGFGSYLHEPVHADLLGGVQAVLSETAQPN